MALELNLTKNTNDAIQQFAVGAVKLIMQATGETTIELHGPRAVLSLVWVCCEAGLNFLIGRYLTKKTPIPLAFWIFVCTFAASYGLQYPETRHFNCFNSLSNYHLEPEF